MVRDKLGGNFFELIVTYPSKDLTGPVNPLYEVDTLALVEEMFYQARHCAGEETKLNRLWSFGKNLF